MKVSSYKNILFIEENINVETLNKERFEIKTSGFGNQLKNLNDLKEQIYIKIANSSQKYNVVYNFRYGQKQNIIALDDIASVSYTHLDVYKRQIQNDYLFTNRFIVIFLSNRFWLLKIYI